MNIRLQELSTSPQHQICFDYTIDLSKEEVGFEYPFQQPVRLTGAVCDDAGVLSLEAEVRARVFTHCSRCCTPVEYDKVTPVYFTLVKELANEEEDRDDLLVIETDDLELDEIFVSELLLDMEMTVLCREDCRGLCPKCGRNLNDGDCGCDLREPDPRLASLAEWLRKNKEES